MYQTLNNEIKIGVRRFFILRFYWLSRGLKRQNFKTPVVSHKLYTGRDGTTAIHSMQISTDE